MQYSPKYLVLADGNAAITLPCIPNEKQSDHLQLYQEKARQTKVKDHQRNQPR